jgi:predicted transcriptional regulator
MAVETPIPPTIAALLSNSILSIEELEVLMRLRADRATRTAPELAESLNIPESIAESALESLLRAGFLSVDTLAKRRVYAFAPQSEALAGTIEAFATYYRENRMQVILTISSKAMERMRHGVLQRFSDAFRFSRDKKHSVRGTARAELPYFQNAASALE